MVGLFKSVGIFINVHKELITFLFGGCGILFFTALYKWIKMTSVSLTDMIRQVEAKGLYLKCDAVKKLRVEKTIKTDFPEYSDYLFIQYGSSVSSSVDKPNDFDFIVLLLGHPKDNVKLIHNSGSYPSINDSANKEATYVDIVYRDYLSFLFAACAGMPYENSVIVNSKLLHGHKGYYKWLSNITQNSMFDKDFLVRRFDEKIISERDTLENEKKYHADNEYNIIRAGYYYITSLIQRELLKKKDKVLFQDDVVKLSNVRKIGEEYFFDNKEILRKYGELIDWLKRKNAECCIDYIDEIITYVGGRIDEEKE